MVPWMNQLQIPSTFCFNGYSRNLCHFSLIHAFSDDPGRFWGVLTSMLWSLSRKRSWSLACSTHLHSCSRCCSSPACSEMIYCPVLPQNNSQAINWGLGHHKLYLGNPPGWDLDTTSVSLSLLKPRQQELFQARAILASKKEFPLGGSRLFPGCQPTES